MTLITKKSKYYF